MIRTLLTVAATVLATGAPLAFAAPAAAETLFYSYQASDRLTRGLTSDITFELDRGLFGGISLRRIYSNAGRAEVVLTSGGPGQVLRALPEDAEAGSVYGISTDQGQGMPMVRALCPGADAAWLVAGRVRAARPLTMHAVGRWADGTFRHCVTLSYAWRGEWATAPAPSPVE